MSSEFRFKNTVKTRNYFLEEIKQNELMNRKHKNVCITLNYIEHFLILASRITGSISISNFASLLDISIEITSSVIGLKICAITAGTKKYKSLNKITNQSKLNSTEVLISKALIDSYISHDEFLLINNMLKEYEKIKEDIKN